MKEKIILFCIILLTYSCHKQENSTDTRLQETSLYRIDSDTLEFELSVLHTRSGVKASAGGPSRVEYKGYSFYEVVKELEMASGVKILLDTAVHIDSTLNLSAYFKGGKPVNYNLVVDLLARSLNLSATYDSLTGLANRIRFKNFVNLSQAKEYNKLDQQGPVMRITNPTPVFLAGLLSRHYGQNFSAENDSVIWPGTLQIDLSAKPPLGSIAREMNLYIDTTRVKFVARKIGRW